MRNSFILLIFAAVLGIVCTRFPPKETPTPEPKVLESTGAIASYYGDDFQGRCMANGLMFNKNDMVAAHRTLPLGTQIRVHRGARSVVLTVTDRGPYIEGRHIDLSEGAARVLHMTHVGVSPVVIEVIDVPIDSGKHHHKNRACLASA